MNTTQSPLTPETFHAAFAKRAMLMVIVGDYSGVRALRLSRLVFDIAPAFMPEFTAACLDANQGPRTAAWVMAEDARNIPGAWDLYVAARETAANRTW